MTEFGRPGAAWPPGVEVPFDPVAEEGLYSREPVAGSDERWKLESRIRFGKACVLRADQATLDDLRLQVDRDAWDYSSVFFPVNLDPLTHGFYRSLRVTALFRDPDVVAKYLSPSAGNTFVPFDGRAASSGLGMCEMSWTLEPGETQDRLRPEAHTVMCFVQRPKTTATVEVVIKVEVGITRTFIVVHHRTAATRKPAGFRLSFTDGSFVPLPG